MTTTVTISTHNWPVRVGVFDAGSKAVFSRVIPPDSSSIEYIHSTRQLHISELPEPAK